MARSSAPPPGYDPSAYPLVAVTVDVVVLTIVERQLKVLLIERGGEPFKGCWALPGGFIHPDETLDAAAARELEEETGVDAAKFVEQLRAFGDPERDERMRIVTVAYLAVIPAVGPTQAGTDARYVDLVAVDQVIRPKTKYPLAFDHVEILKAGLAEARSRLETTSIATSFLGKTFTLSELRAVYEAVWGCELDPGNFRRKVLATRNFVVPTGKRAIPGPEGGKPPDIYRAGTRVSLDPPLRRPARP